jgi:hypothetical protein
MTSSKQARPSVTFGSSWTLLVMLAHQVMTSARVISLLCYLAARHADNEYHATATSCCTL